MINSAPDARDFALSSALARSEPLSNLLQRMRASQRRFEIVVPLLPAALARAVRHGPLDDDAWTLLVDNAAAAAKLRQSLPTLVAALTEQGLGQPGIRIKILPRGQSHPPG